jgi:hypothetical protein
VGRDQCLVSQGQCCLLCLATLNDLEVLEFEVNVEEELVVVVVVWESELNVECE